MRPRWTTWTALESPRESLRPSNAISLGASLLVAALTAAVLVLTAYDQFYDTNFYTLWEATAVLAGDHPYRDFYEWGVPMQAVFSAAGQLGLGNRLLGEFGLQWLGIVCGAVVSFRLAVRLSGSTIASLVTASIPLILVAATPTYHYPKLFFYPFAIWLAWRYMDRPTVAVSATLGLTTAMAFLFRHDHGLYIGGLSLLAFVLAGWAAASPRGPRALLTHGTAYAAAALVLLTPWLVFVQTSEGLAEYVRQRLALQELLVGTESYWPYWSLLDMDPAGPLRSAFHWRLPTPEDGVMWLQQTALLVPLVSMLLAGGEILRGWRRGDAAPQEVYPVILVSAFLAVVDNRLFRESSYVIVVAPLTAALATRLLVPRGGRPTTVDVARRRGLDIGWTALVWGVAAIVLAGAGLSAASFSYRTGVFTPHLLAGTVGPTFARLLASPPIDGLLPLDVMRQYGPTNWADFGSGDRLRLRIRYMHDCTRPGDRLLITGSTPFDISYYAGRSIAGGHLFWHQRWRADSAHEAESLALLTQQAVPFVYSTTDPVLDDFAAYPRILAYLTEHYAEPEGAEGRLLVDTRRAATGRFEPMGWPCFR